MSVRIRIQPGKDVSNIVVIDSRRRFKYITKLGFYLNSNLYLDFNKFSYWISNGAQVSKRVHSLLDQSGLLDEQLIKKLWKLK